MSGESAKPDPCLVPDLGPALDLRDELNRGRSHIRDFHSRGGSGQQVTAALTSLCDRIIARAYEIVNQQTGNRDRIANELALLAVGGYGRGDLAPFSDVDLLFLTAQPADELLRKFISSMVRLLWDSGLSIAQSVRTPQECVAFAEDDLPAWTALTEARLLRGNVPLFKDLSRRIDRLVGRRSVRHLAESVIGERNKEQTDDIDSTVYLLEPNVKKSAGGLRDYHLIRWVGRTRYGSPEPPVLYEQGHLSERDCEQILATRELLLRIRNELHFDVNAAQDILTLGEQERLSAWLGWTGGDALLPVERFMQDYYRHTTALHEISLRFARQAWAPRPQPWRTALFRRRIEDPFALESAGIRIRASRRRGIDVLPSDVWMQLFELARCHDVPVDPTTLEEARASIPACELTPSTRALFQRALAHPLGLGRLLRDLHAVHLLGRLIPPFEHIRCLIQFNHYHKYTVDEHTLRAVEAVCRRIDDRGPIGAAYRQIRRKDLLHLALLLHDVGKGYPEDHSEKGAELSDIVARQFELPQHDREVLIHLVRHHLLMANIAQRRDLSDPQTIVNFTRAIGTPEMLQLLFVLTAADTEAVGPGNLSTWKELLLTELYARSMQELTGHSPASEDEVVQAQRKADAVLAALPQGLDPGLASTQLAQMAPTYLVTTEPSRIHAHLASLQQYQPGEILVTNDYDATTGVSAYTIVLERGERPGLFANIAGVLASAGLQILSAQIVTRPDGLVIDTFETLDTDFAGFPPPHRREHVARQITEVLQGQRTVESLLGGRFVPRASRLIPNPAPTKVEIDNTSSDRFTIVEVFAVDRQGLLYVITRTLADLAISVHSAKIATHVDQAVDVFYVTESDGLKLTDAARLRLLRDELVRRIEAYAGPV